MRRVWLAVVFAMLPSVAAAEPVQLGAFFGPRLFSDDSLLGYIDDLPAHPTLSNSVGLGGRLGRPFGFVWLVPEVELVVVPTQSTRACVGASCAEPVTVVWMEPRFQLRFELLPKRPVQPFLLVGGGSPVSLSFARKTFNSGIVGEGYIGAGVRLNTQKGFVLRLDGRFSVGPGAMSLLAYEGDVTLGLEFAIGGPKKVKVEEVAVQAGPPADKDGDGLADNVDKCPDRAEDSDNFEDGDGCPDIDNDGDRVLDIADKCADGLENLNGYADDDGCPDTIPPEVEGLRGSVEGLLYAEGETVVRDSAKRYLQKIVKVMTDHPSIRVVLIGHTDDREAKAFLPPKVEGQPAPDVATIATDLARARAEAVRQALVAAGVPAGRMVIDGVGAEEPVAENTSSKGRLANRRVEIKLFVPK